MVRRVLTIIIFHLSSLLAFSVNLETKKIENLISEANAQIHINQDLAYTTIVEALEIAKEIDYDWGLVQCNYYLGYIEEFRGRLDKAAIHYFESLRYSDFGSSAETQNYYIIANNINVGRIFHSHHQYDQAVIYFEKALDFAYKKGHYELLEKAYFDKARSLKKVGKQLEALNCLFESAKRAEANNNNDMLAQINLQLGLIFKDLGDFEKSREHYGKVFQFNQVDNYYEYAWTACHNIATTYILENEFNSAKEYYMKAIDYSENSKNKKVVFITYMDFGEQLIIQGHLQLAEKYYLKAIGLDLNLDGDPDKFKIYKQLATLYGHMGNAEKFTEYNTKYTECLEQHLKTREELAQMDQQYNIQLVTQRYFELVESQKRMAALKKYGGFVIAGLLSLILVYLIFLRVRKTRLKKSLEQALREATQGLDFDL